MCISAKKDTFVFQVNKLKCLHSHALSGRLPTWLQQYMKVVFDHTIFVQKFGGVSRYICELANHLNRIEGAQASVVAPFFPNAYLQTLNKSVLKGPYWDHKFRGGHRIAQLGRAALLPIYYRLESDADIVHETYYSVSAFGKAKRRVVTVYDMLHEAYGSLLDGDIGSSKEKRMSVERADHVICISEFTRRELMDRFGTDESKTSVVHLASSLTGFRTAEQTPLDLGRPYILFVGRRYNYKNFKRLCEAFAGSERLRKDFLLCVFGGGVLTADERIDLERLGLTDLVRHVSGGDDALVSAYKGAHLLVYPSEREGFGLPPLEAMSVGCPVCCSDSTSLPEVVGDGGLYFDPVSSEDMAHKIEMLAYDLELRASMISRGLLRSAEFSWSRCAQETLSVYKHVLGGTP